MVVSTPPSAGRLLVIAFSVDWGLCRYGCNSRRPLANTAGTSHVHSLIALPPAASKLPVLFAVTHTLCTPYGFSPFGTREQRDRQGTV